MPDHPRPKGRAYLYLMGGDGGEHRFTVGTFQDLAEEGICLSDGMALGFYCDDGNDQGEPDYMLFDGVAKQHPDGTWWAIVTNDEVWHESDERG